MLTEIERERKTKRKRKNVAKRARLLVSQSLRRVRFFPSLFGPGWRGYPRGRWRGVGSAVSPRPARWQDGPGGPRVACARQTARADTSHCCYVVGWPRILELHDTATTSHRDIHAPSSRENTTESNFYRRQFILFSAF